MKKFISVFLCVIVFAGNIIFTPYLSVVYGADAVVGIVKNISLDYVVNFFKSLYSVGYGIAANGSGDSGAVSSSLDSIWGENSSVNKWIQTKLFPFMDANGNVDLTKPDCPITYDNEKQLVNFNPTFTKELGEQVQDKVHALDGYYLFEPANSSLSASIPIIKNNFSDIYKNNEKKLSFIQSDSFNKELESFYKEGSTACVFTCFHNSDDSYWSRFIYYITDYDAGFDYNNYLYLSGGSLNLYRADSNRSETFTSRYFNVSDFLYIGNEVGIKYTEMFDCIKNSMDYAIGSPFRIFYSLQDLKNFLNKGKQRTYAPKLPSTTISIPIKYINNTTELPDLSFNLDSLIGKAEMDIQAGLDAQLKLYLDKLAEVNINPDKPVSPTPTPDGGFTDGTTPTPKPDFGDDSNPTDTNDWLKKIYEWLQSFGDTHSKFEKTITDYIEANDGKLDQIIEAINALSDGKTEDEKNGCKYDFTALSDFMTKLWNESDKKFDKMVELLEENNKYQKKLVNSLNEIKAILVTQTIMDVFQDRSQQTAEKAKDKFPTSLPWDIALVVNAMSAEPEKPQFDLPIQIKSLNINEEIHVDLATGEWEKLAKTCRYLLSILFILLLVQLSRKLFSNGGND